MSDKQKVLDAMGLLQTTCSDALLLLSQPELYWAEQTPVERPPLVIIHKDFTSLLSLVYTSTTKLAIALKPSSPTHPAALTPIKEITERIAAVAHCVLLIDPSIHGAILSREAIGNAKDIVDATLSLTHTFISADSNSNAGETYLTKTGTVHELIDKGKMTSRDNNTAVRKQWKQDKATLTDGIDELHEMITESENEPRDTSNPNGFGDDDGWDELGLDSSRKMDTSELNRSRKAYTLLRMTALLHKRIPQDILASPLASHHPPSVFDKLCSLSTTLQFAADDLIASLYVPQDPSYIREEFQAFQDAVTGLRDVLIEQFLPPLVPLATQLEHMTLSPSGQPNVVSTPRLDSTAAKWFYTCFDQLDKAIQAFLSDLE